MSKWQESIDDAHEEGRQDGAAMFHDKPMGKAVMERYLNRHVYDWLVRNSERMALGEAYEAYKAGFREGHKP